jgi:hypothetical protein
LKANKMKNRQTLTRQRLAARSATSKQLLKSLAGPFLSVTRPSGTCGMSRFPAATSWLKAARSKGRHGRFPNGNSLLMSLPVGKESRSEGPSLTFGVIERVRPAACVCV